MRKYSVRITPSAIRDIEEIAEFYAEIVDDDSATRFSDDVIATLEHLDTFPERHAYFDEALDLRRVLIRNHNVSVVYMIDNGVYEVIAFGAFHDAAEPKNYRAMFKERLKELEN